MGQKLHWPVFSLLFHLSSVSFIYYFSYSPVVLFIFIYLFVIRLFLLFAFEAPLKFTYLLILLSLITYLNSSLTRIQFALIS